MNLMYTYMDSDLIPNNQSETRKTCYLIQLYTRICNTEKRGM